MNNSTDDMTTVTDYKPCLNFFEQMEVISKSRLCFLSLTDGFSRSVYLQECEGKTKRHDHRQDEQEDGQRQARSGLHARAQVLHVRHHRRPRARARETAVVFKKSQFKPFDHSIGRSCVDSP